MADCETCKHMWWFSLGRECHCLPNGYGRILIIEDYPTRLCDNYQEAEP